MAIFVYQRQTAMAKKSAKRPSPKTAPILSESVQREFALFLQHHPPKAFARDLRNVIIDYSAHQLNGWSVYANHHFLLGILGLLDVLDAAEEEWTERDISELLD